MNPRPRPTTTDTTAALFVNAALRLVDACLAAGPRHELPPRLRALHFPAPLDWIRIEDVVREARQDAPRLSAKAFWNRWPDKDSFLVDVGRMSVADDSVPRTRALRGDMVDTDATFSERIQVLCGTLMTELVALPRSYLLGFLAPIMHASAALQEAVLESTRDDVIAWVAFYDAVVASAGLNWRPGWDAARAQIVVQSLIDGLLLRRRLVPALPDGTAWDLTSTFTDAIIALFTSILDLDGDRRPVAELLDAGVAAAQERRAH